jgi:hypothetical protein
LVDRCNAGVACQVLFDQSPGEVPGNQEGTGRADCRAHQHEGRALNKAEYCTRCEAQD